MLKHFLFAVAVLSITFTPAFAQGKPADLPSNFEVECGDEPGKGKLEIRLGFGAKGLIFEVNLSKPAPEMTPTLDAVLPAFVEQWLSHMGDAVMQPARGMTWDGMLGKIPYVRALASAKDDVQAPAAAEPEKQARRLFDLAELHRRLGNHETARFIYQRVHLVSPTTWLGRLAIERLCEIEIPRGGAEEQDTRPEDPDALARDLRSRTVPLGLVEVVY